MELRLSFVLREANSPPACVQADFLRRDIKRAKIVTSHPQISQTLSSGDIV